MPSEAMMKANSPICDMLKPHFIASFRGCPAKTKPKVPNRACPTTMVSTKATMGHAYSTNTTGSTNMPTETKKMAPNQSFTGATNFSMRSASTVSAKIDPTTKAPNAALNPESTAMTAIMKQSAKAKMSNVSSFRKRRLFRRIMGMKYKPTTNQSTKKKPNRSNPAASSSPSMLWLTAKVDSITISTMAKMSSKIRTLSTIPANFFCKMPKS